MSNDTDITGTEMLNAQIAAARSRNFQTDGNGESDEYNYPYVIFQLFENKFAVSCKYVVSIEQMAETKELVSSSRDVRGISYYKSEPINVFDLRRLFGIISENEYINEVANIPRRITEHENYVNTLKSCVDSHKPFELTVDPHKCNFGKWFYEYKNKAANLEVRKEIEKVEGIHEKFHASAKTVRDFIARDKTEEAAIHLKEIDKLKIETVRRLNSLNDAIIRNMTELNVVLQLNDKKIGLIVDSAESVEEIDDIQYLPQSVIMTKFIKRLGLSKKEKQIIFILEANEFNDQ